MKKYLFALFCALLLGCTGCAPTALADEGPYYPISVEEYTWGSFDTMRVQKVYQLSLSDDPANIPKDDFERSGFLYQFLEMTEQNEIGVDKRDYEQSITKDSATAEMSEVLKQLDAELPVKTEDGYEGTLLLDHTSVRVSVKGYQTSSKNITATRVYPNLSDADLSLIPKSVTENGNSLTLNDAQWESGTDEDGNLTFTATAEYYGTSTSRYATGYTVSANYTGKVAKTGCEIVTYTLTFAGTPIPPEPAPEPETAADETERKVFPLDGRDWLSLAGCGGGIAAVAAAILLSVKKLQEKRRENP